MNDDPLTVSVRSPKDLLGMVPFLLGYHPRDSIVALFLGADSRVAFAGCADAGTPPELVAQAFTEPTMQHEVASMVLVGYGPARIAQTVWAVADGLPARIPVISLLRVSGELYFCLRCPCPDADGVVFDPRTTASALAAVARGLVALPARTDLLALVAPDPVAQAGVAAAITSLPPHTDPGLAVLRYLMDRAADGLPLDDGQVARLVVLLRDVTVRDAAWRASRGEMWQRDLWLDVCRRTPDGYLPAPATLAGWCAYAAGNQPLAAAALGRALTADPNYGVARLLDWAVRHHIPPSEILANTLPQPGQRR